MATISATRRALLAHALKHEGAWEDHPWGEDVAKVGKKIFVFFGQAGPDLGVGVKLNRSLLYARAQPFVQKMGYGMDKSGWVAARFAKGDEVPVELVRNWIDESYEAVAAAALPKGRPLTKTTRRPAARR
jgi:predicted DNA-binding protein (MmcQ/YjbR family)